jgi:hypothetical protein
MLDILVNIYSGNRFANILPLIFKWKYERERERRERERISFGS